MPDKEFEQQVREGLQGLELPPSPVIRQAVLDAIRRRRRRGFILWVPVGLLSLGGMLWGGWYALEGRKPVGSGAAVVTNRVGVAGGAVSQPGAAPGTGQTRPSPAAQGSGGNRPSPANVGSVDAPVTSGARAEGGRSVDGTPQSDRAGSAGVANTPSATGTEASANAAASATGNTTPAVAAATRVDTAATASSPAAHPRGPLTSVGATADLHRFDFSAAHLTPAQLKRNAEKKTSPWTFRLNGNLGFSGQGPFLQFHTPAKTLYAPFISSPGSLSSSGSGNLATGYYDTLATRKTGAGWSIGMSASRRLSAHLRLDMGLAYDHLETRMGPVAKNSAGSYSALDAYNSSGTSQSLPSGSGSGAFDYINRYRLLRLPLDLAWTVTPSARWTPTFYLGLSPAFLFSGDALMYAPNAVGYEKNKTLYRHLSLYGEMGGMIDLWRSGRFALEAGPFIQYGFSGIQKATPVKDHLNYAGLRLGIAIPSKSNKP
ncbi:hypothetical protein [Dinghuibacter silviterrae]|uniref:Outer membrane protein with beta-barrel domain n=1 Tax=Dinghuibacter silviterrae TaxID=1539049 RepID=A0A4R8DRE9_9BACT|nr:hypothetical protein [Dinghuibacter silviterrae]TDX00770.1 hypothetical protein EDB95_1799 [Dinghuibacter silviterrae]